MQVGLRDAPEGLRRVANAQTASAYLVAARMYDRLLAVWRTALHHLRDRRDWCWCCDQAWKVRGEARQNSDIAWESKLEWDVRFSLSLQSVDND